MCCCCDKQTGHLVIVWLTLVYCIAAFILGIVQASYSYGSASGGFVVGSVFCIIGIGLCVLDIYGIHKNNRLFMIPFFIWMVITAILTGLGTVIAIIMVIVQAPALKDSDYKDLINGIYAAVIIILLLTFILYSYFCHVIWSHMKEVKAQEMQPVRQGDVPMKSRRESWVTY